MQGRVEKPSHVTNHKLRRKAFRASGNVTAPPVLVDVFWIGSLNPNPKPRETVQTEGPAVRQELSFR